MATRRAIHLPLMAAISIALLPLSACGLGGGASAGAGAWGWTAESPTRLCVDRNQNRLPDAQCMNGHRGGYARWYYLNRGGFVPAVGRYATGGTFAPTRAPGLYKSTEASMNEARAVQRGAFGDLTGGRGGGFLANLFSGRHAGG